MPQPSRNPLPLPTDSGDGGNDTRPPPKDLSHHLSRSTKARGASSMKAFYKYFTIPGIGQLAGGLPNNYYFPFDTLEAKVAEPNRSGSGTDRRCTMRSGSNTSIELIMGVCG